MSLGSYWSLAVKMKTLRNPSCDIIIMHIPNDDGQFIAMSSRTRQAEHVQAPLASYEQHYVELAHSKTPILLES